MRHILSMQHVNWLLQQDQPVLAFPTQEGVKAERRASPRLDTPLPAKLLLQMRLLSCESTNILQLFVLRKTKQGTPCTDNSQTVSSVQGGGLWWKAQPGLGNQCALPLLWG